MKKARMNISHSRFILSKLKIFGEIVTTIFETFCFFPKVCKYYIILLTVLLIALGFHNQLLFLSRHI